MGEEWSGTDIIRTLPVRKKEGGNVVQATGSTYYTALFLNIVP